MNNVNFTKKNENDYLREISIVALFQNAKTQIVQDMQVIGQAMFFQA